MGCRRCCADCSPDLPPAFRECCACACDQLCVTIAASTAAQLASSCLSSCANDLGTIGPCFCVSRAQRVSWDSSQCAWVGTVTCGFTLSVDLKIEIQKGLNTGTGSSDQCYLKITSACLGLDGALYPLTDCGGYRKECDERGTFSETITVDASGCGDIDCDTMTLSISCVSFVNPVGEHPGTSPQLCKGCDCVCETVYINYTENGCGEIQAATFSAAIPGWQATFNGNCSWPSQTVTITVVEGADRCCDLQLSVSRGVVYDPASVDADCPRPTPSWTGGYPTGTGTDSFSVSMECTDCGNFFIDTDCCDNVPLIIYARICDGPGCVNQCIALTMVSNSSTEVEWRGEGTFECLEMGLGSAPVCEENPIDLALVCSGGLWYLRTYCGDTLEYEKGPISFSCEPLCGSTNVLVEDLGVCAPYISCTGTEPLVEFMEQCFNQAPTTAYAPVKVGRDSDGLVEVAIRTRVSGLGLPIGIATPYSANVITDIAGEAEGQHAATKAVADDGGVGGNTAGLKAYATATVTNAQVSTGGSENEGLIAEADAVPGTPSVGIDNAGQTGDANAVVTDAVVELGVNATRGIAVAEVYDGKVCEFENADGTEYNNPFTSSLGTGWTQTAGSWYVSSAVLKADAGEGEDALVLNRVRTSVAPTKVVMEVEIDQIDGSPYLRLSLDDITTDFVWKATWGSPSGDLIWFGFGASNTISGVSINDGDYLAMIVEKISGSTYKACYYHNEVLMMSARGSWFSSASDVYYGLGLDDITPDTVGNGSFNNFSVEINT